MTSDMKKFLFDNNDFDAPPAPPAPPAPTYTQEQLTAAQEASFSQGHAAGAQEAHATREEEIKNHLHAISLALEKLVQAEDRRELEQMMGAARLSLRITGKLLPAFAARHALAEIERVVQDALEPRLDEPRLTVCVAAAHAEEIRARISELAAQRGYEGKIVLQADDSLSGSDCRIEWADGGAERLFEGLFARIEDELEKAVAGMKAAEPKNDD